MVDPDILYYPEILFSCSGENMSNKNISYSERFNSKTRIIFSFKVILREIIRNDDTALPLCWDIVSNVYNIVATSQSCVDCKTFRIFAYSSTREQSNKRCGTRLKTESETGFFSLASHARRACEARAVRAHKSLTPRVTDFFADFEEKTDCFAV